MKDLSQIQQQAIEFKKMDTKGSILPSNHISQKISNLEAATLTSNLSMIEKPGVRLANEVKDPELKALVGKVYDTSCFDLHSGNLSQFQQQNRNLDELSHSALFNLLMVKVKKSEKRIQNLIGLNKELIETVVA
mmetsp:Transcript_27842/g.42105  ORF Transcript_27842/g.42105 Transcript_27842/m.42105 type:complete len:134 (+) Transcript_27842:1079-1480(+)|eukprot:CAMPEP_0170501412 /NCGR_PEP_ID=MMETSP0208-20121228/38197_1 /TAXON_ID=197538 /ORGANISM="Strombidium inclinatum, Strain S3" /LENGTH=133 /DNA_ID=CAMNT_0010779949 /DNA_START=1072 /DNA_END=1473 /DNA_ORIENTATION=-